jgi:SAM-dependent methyltransferase
MVPFKHRSYQKEILDRSDIPFADIEQNMKELDVINHKLGGHSITLKGFRRLMDSCRSKQIIQIVEIGCGGGDNLRIIKNYANENGIDVKLTGVDINPDCISFAKAHNNNTEIDFICEDYKNFYPVEKPDMIFNSLFCHHFADEELVGILQWMKINSTAGFFINDLHRHPVAYYSIKFLTKLFSKSRLVKNDAPLSVLRGFVKKDWEQILKQAGIKDFKIEWCWAFRWLITYHN